MKQFSCCQQLVLMQSLKQNGITSNFKFQLTGFKQKSEEKPEENKREKLTPGDKIQMYTNLI